MIVRMPTITSTSVTNRPKLSATMTPKLAALRFQSSTDEIAAPTRPTMPRPPSGMFSSRPRNASAPMTASAARVTHSIGTTASREELSISVRIVRIVRRPSHLQLLASAWTLCTSASTDASIGLRNSVGKHAHHERDGAERQHRRPLARQQIRQRGVLLVRHRRRSRRAGTSTACRPPTG